MVPLSFMAESIGYDVSFSEGWVYLSYSSKDESQDYVLFSIENGELVYDETGILH